MMIQSDLLVTGLTLLGGGAVGASLGGAMGGLIRWGGGRLHLFVIGCMAAGAGMGFTYGGPSSVPGYVDAAEAGAMELGLPFGGSEKSVLRVLKAYYPDDYAGVASALAHAKPERHGEVLARALRPMLSREMPMADTDNAVALLKLERRKQVAMMGDPSRCYRTMRGARSASAEVVQTEALREDEMRVAARLLTQTALSPKVSPLPADVHERVRRLAEAALDDLPPAERQALLSIRGAPTAAQASAACELGVKLYDAMLLAPDAEAADMFKGLQSTGLQHAVYAGSGARAG